MTHSSSLAMERYSVQTRDRIFVKEYGIMSFARNMGKSEKISKNLSSKYSQKLLDHAKKSATDGLKTASKRAIHQTAETTDHLLKITDRLTKVSKTSPKNNSETN